MQRALILLIVVSGCDSVFGLDGNVDTIDAPRLADAPVMDARVDAAPGDPGGVIGCADGTREGFASIGDYPMLAACNGAWKVGGLFAPRQTGCDLSGNSTSMSTGMCAAVDLCSSGWHICATSLEVQARGAASDCDQAFTTQFYATQQPSMQEICGGAAADADEIVGCGISGVKLAQATCTPFLHASGSSCVQLSGDGMWSCEDFSEGNGPLQNVLKLATGDGGVMCCKD